MKSFFLIIFLLFSHFSIAQPEIKNVKDYHFHIDIMVGLQVSEVRDFNENHLKLVNLPQVSSLYYTVGISPTLDFTFKNKAYFFRHDVYFYLQPNTSENQQTLATWGWANTVSLGKVLIQNEKIRFSMLVGAGETNTYFRFFNNSTTNSFTQTLQNPDQQSYLSHSRSVLQTAIQLDFFTKNKKRIGIYTGYAFGSLFWKNQEWTKHGITPLYNPPSINMGGFFFRLNIGI